MTLRKPKRGERWRPDADRDGQVADAVNWVQRRQQAIGPGDAGGAPDTGRCLAANGTCDDFDLYDAVQIDSPINFPSDSEPEWAEGIPAYRVLTPESANARIALLIDPLPTCTMRRAIVSGLCRTKVNISDASHKWATVEIGSRRLVSTSNANSPCEIIWHEAGTGERLADVLLSTRHAAPAVPQPSVTPASPVDGVLNDCAGRCKFIWSESLDKWIKSEEDSTCGQRTTTTGTSSSTSSSTTGTGTETSTTTTTTPEPCCPFAARESDIPTTTTTPDPEASTTTPEPCDCLWPTFCGTADGQCAYTDCVSGASNQEPVCGSTTAAPTTTCDCDNTAIPPECVTGCDWIGIPVGTTWAWRKVSDGCSSNCPCPEPDTNPYCNTAHTDCEIIIPPSPPGDPGCVGQCTYWWLPAIDAWHYVGGNCTAGVAGCGCQAPSYDGSACAPVTVPCVSPPDGTTTTAEPLPYDSCVYTCHGVGTTSTSTTPVPDTNCQSGGCLWDWNGSASWVLISDDCPGALGCYCLYPGRDGLDDCEVMRTGCTHIDLTTTTTSTSTTSTSTTSTSSTTGTTTQPPCPEGQAALRCVGIGGGTYVWELVIACEPGTGDYDVATCGPCTDPGVGQVCCVDCTTTTTTTSTSTSTTTSTSTSTTSTSTTSTSTSSTTSTTCEPCNASDVADLIAGGNRYAYHFIGGVYVLCDQNCDAGSVPPDPDVGCVNPGTECEYCNGLCDTTTSTTSTSTSTTTTTQPATSTTTTQEACNGQGSWSCEWDAEFVLWSWMPTGNNCGGLCGEGYTCQPIYPGGGCDAEHEHDTTGSNCDCVEDSA